MTFALKQYLKASLLEMRIGRKNTIHPVGFGGNHANTVRKTPVFIGSGCKSLHSLRKPLLIQGQHLLPQGRVADEVKDGGSQGLVL
jgi:hypothetical protein